MPSISQESIVFALQCATVIAGLGWIGLQFVVDGRELRTDARATWWWLRWCAMLTFVGCWAIVTVRSAGGVPFRAPAMTLFMSTAVPVTLAWFHVWFVSWPGVQIGSDDPRIAASLRANMVLTVPAVFFFYASAYRQDFGGNGKWIPSEYWLATGIAYGGIGALVIFMPNVLRSLLAFRPVALGGGAALTALVTYL